MRISLPNPHANPCALDLEFKCRINNTRPKAKWRLYLFFNAMRVVRSHAKLDSNLIRNGKNTCI